MLFELADYKLKELAERWAIPGWVFFVLGLLWDVWLVLGHASTAQSVWGWIHPARREPSLSSPSQANVTGWNLIIPQVMIVVGLLWLSILVFAPALFGGQLRRLRALIKQLTRFVDKNEGNVYKIHFGYDADFRTRVDRMFSELAAEEIVEIVDGDWVVNPQTQTAKNIRENVIARLERLADKLEKRQSAPRSKIIGSIEEAHVLAMTSGVDRGKQTRSTMIGFRLRVTNKAKIETSVKRAHVIVRAGGEEYKGSNEALWLTSDKPRKDFLKGISRDTPITHSLPTEGWIDFVVNGLEITRALTADVSVVLIDEFEVPHTIRNKWLRIAA